MAGADRSQGFDELTKKIVSRGLCTSCGTCVGVCPTKCLEMRRTIGDPEPELVDKCSRCRTCIDVCPGGDVPFPAIEEKVFGRKRSTEIEEELGIFRACFRSRARDVTVRENASSGGSVSALISYALEEAHIDGVVFAGFSEKEPWKCVSTIATASGTFLERKANSAMLMVATNELLGTAVLENGLKRIAVVGLPCQIHGLRKIQLLQKPARIAQAIKFTIGLFCASNSYHVGTEHFIMEIGRVSSLEDIAKLSYRGGEYPGSFQLQTKHGKDLVVGTRHDYVYHWLPASNFRRDRCLVCPDFSAELADISIGDTYIPIGTGSPRWNALLTRTETGETLVNNAANKGYLELQSHDLQLIIRSGYGWEAKKHGNVFRLSQREKYKWPVPDFHRQFGFKIVKRKLFVK